jgi:phage repressor protein C with HTH and peptisase S24 domain
MEMILGQGDSMKGLFGNGDPIQVDRGVRSFRGDGVYVFRVGDDEFIRNLQRIPNEGVVV